MRPVDRRRRDGLRHVAGTGLWAAIPLWAGTASASAERAGSREASPVQDPSGLMRWVQNAMTQRSFAGTYVVTAGGSMTSSRIVHLCDGRSQIERIEALDGQARQIYRHNETVHVFWPATKEASVEQRTFIRRFPLQAAPNDAAPLDMYELTDSGQERIAGQDALVLTFRARDPLRFGQRWWVDRKTGLLLRADTFGPQGEVIESAAFSEIQIGSRISPQQLLQEMNRLEGFRVRRPLTESTALEAEGWTLSTAVAGFRPVSTVRRQRTVAVRPVAEAVASGAAPATIVPMIQSIFSDGMTHVSLFIEPFTAQPRRGEKLMTAGATHALSRRMGDWWITAVGDVPVETLTQFTAALERRRP